MRSIVVLTFIAVAMLVALFSRFAGLLLYWWFATFRPQDWIWADVSHLKLSLVAGLLLVVPSFIMGKFPRLGHTISYLMLLWVLLAAVANYRAGCGEEGLKWLDHLARLMLVLFLTNRLVTTRKRLFWLCSVVAGSIAFFSAKAGFFSILQGGAVQYGASNLKGTLAGSNAFALATSMLIFWMIASAQNALNPNADDENELGEPRKLHRAVYLGMSIAVPLSIYQVVSLFSRGAAIGLALGFLVFLWLQKQRGAWFFRLAPILMLGTLFIPVPEGYRERMSSVFAERQELDASAASRPFFWRVAMTMASDHPMGVGPGCFSSYYDDYDHSVGAYGRARSVHSSHMQALAETGYLGLGVWVALFGLSTRVLLKVRRVARSGNVRSEVATFLETYSNALIASMVTFAVGGAVYELAHNEFTWLTFTLAVILDRLAGEAEAEGSGEAEGIVESKRLRPWYQEIPG